MLLDTSGLLCYFDEADARHSDAVTFFNAAETRVTHNYVLAEFVPLCHVRRLNRTKALSFAAELLDNALIEVLWVTQTHHRSAISLLQAQLDKTYSLCDAVSFVLMQERNISEALTTDRHFVQAGFRSLLRDGSKL